MKRVDEKYTSSKDSSDSQNYFNKTEEQKYLPGKVTLFGKILASIARFFRRITTWFTGAIYRTLLGGGKFGFFRKTKDAIIMKILLFGGCIVGVIVAYKSVKGYIKNRKFRKKDQEIGRKYL